MTDATCFFVQFPHPKDEHNPRSDKMPWNVGGHRRKFLIAPGRYLDADSRLDAGTLVFWGEWEPPSRIEHRWPALGRLPRVLHRPYWTEPSGMEFRQNTDPWIWGKTMFYSCCKQVTGRNRRPTSMQRLTPGSVICFGSTIEREFCVDTVFVVASAEPWVAAEGASLDADEAFVACTARSVATSADDAHVPFTLYRGATVDRPMNGMFSFVPACRADYEAPRFARPQVRVSGLINPASRQSTWGSKRPLDVDMVRNAWGALVEQVIGAHLVLGVSVDVPPRERTTKPLPTTERSRC